MVKQVVQQVYEAECNGVLWTTPDKKRGHSRPRRQLIKDKSEEQRIVADWTEQGMSIKQATAEVNEFRASVGRGHIGISAVNAAHKRMNPVITRILDRQQGSDDDVAWGLARFRFVLQLRVRYGLLTGTGALEKL